MAQAIAIWFIVLLAFGKCVFRSIQVHLNFICRNDIVTMQNSAQLTEFCVLFSVSSVPVAVAV